MGAHFKGKNFDAIKKEFGLEHETFTPESEKEMLDKFPWILDDFNKKFEELEGT